MPGDAPGKTPVSRRNDLTISASGVPATLLYTSLYWDNLIHFGMAPKRRADGTLCFVLPMGNARLPGIAGEYLTGEQMAEQLSLALGSALLARSQGRGRIPRQRLVVAALTAACACVDGRRCR